MKSTHVRQKAAALKSLSAQQLQVLRNCCRYPIMDDWTRKAYYRLGGYGCAPIRYNRFTLPILNRLGLVRYDSYYVATDAGRALVEEADAAYRATNAEKESEADSVGRGSTQGAAPGIPKSVPAAAVMEEEKK